MKKRRKKMKRLMFFSVILAVAAMSFGCGPMLVCTVKPAGIVEAITLPHGCQAEFVIGGYIPFVYDAYPLRGEHLNFTIQTTSYDNWHPISCLVKEDGVKIKSLGVSPPEQGTILNHRDNSIHYLSVEVIFSKTDLYLDERGQLCRQETRAPSPAIAVLPVYHYSRLK
jgi:hypothetical protein